MYCIKFYSSSTSSQEEVCPKLGSAALFSPSHQPLFAKAETQYTRAATAYFVMQKTSWKRKTQRRRRVTPSHRVLNVPIVWPSSRSTKENSLASTTPLNSLSLTHILSHSLSTFPRCVDLHSKENVHQPAAPNAGAAPRGAMSLFRGAAFRNGQGALHASLFAPQTRFEQRDGPSRALEFVRKMLHTFITRPTTLLEPRHDSNTRTSKPNNLTPYQPIEQHPANVGVAPNASPLCNAEEEDIMASRAQLERQKTSAKRVSSSWIRPETVAPPPPPPPSLLLPPNALHNARRRIQHNTKPPGKQLTSFKTRVIRSFLRLQV